MRVKGANTSKKHKKVLKTTKGYRYSYHKTYKRAHEAYMHAGMYSYKHRRKRIHQFRKLWITRISGAVRNLGHRYSDFMKALKDSNVELNRKMLSELALHKPDLFKDIVQQVFKSKKA